MKKIFLLLLPVLLLTACKKETVTEKQTDEATEAIAAKGQPSKISICHYNAAKGSWKTMSILLTAWPDHEAHGDVRLDDVDGDGYVPNNACGFGNMGDCDDLNAAINPGATEIIGNGIDENCNGMNDDVPAIGSNYLGGKLAYVFQEGDPGYVEGEMHGLIAAATDQSAFIPWYNGSFVATGATGTALGTGMSNTNLIVTVQGTGNYTAKLCADLVLNGYDDWFLPSVDELLKLYLNRAAIGGFTEDYWYSSSSEVNSAEAFVVSFYFGQRPYPKDFTQIVRATRYF